MSTMEEKLRGVGAASIMNEVQEKWKEMGADNIVNTMQEKLKELLLALENFGGYLLGWFDKVLPPETRGEKLRHWLDVASPLLIAGVVLIVFFWCMRWLCCCCWCGGRSVKMMKAPGRNFRMPRHIFESNPRGYFRDLRGKPDNAYLV